MNRSTTWMFVAATAAVCLSASASAGSLVAPEGYYCVDTVFTMPSGAWFGGFDILPNGNFVFSDGYAVREITRAGADVGTLYTYPAYVFGSFVKYNPANQRVYFGESSTGKIQSVPLTGGSASDVVTLAGNFDLDFWSGVPYAVAGTNIYRLNESGGTADAIAELGEASGPLAFDAAGNLVYGIGDYDWSTPRDQKIVRWSAAQVAGAGGGNVLGLADAEVLADNVGPYWFAWNGAAELVFSETVSPSAIKVLTGSEVTTLTTPANSSHSVLNIRYDAGGRLSAAVTWFDEYWNQHTLISTLVPVPEPSSLVILGTLVTLAACARFRRRS